MDDRPITPRERSTRPPPAEKIPVKLVPCSICNRTFAEESVKRHESVCQKFVERPKTAVFDSSRQRAKGSDVKPTGAPPVAGAKVRREMPGPSVERPKTAWKERHEDLIRNVKSAKNVRHALKTGTPLPPPPSSKQKQRPYTSPNH